MTRMMLRNISKMNMSFLLGTVSLMFTCWGTSRTSMTLVHAANNVFDKPSNTPMYDCRYTNPMDIYAEEDQGLVYLEHYINSYEKTITLRMTYNDGYSWMGIGINLLYETRMSPSVAIIGDWDRRIQFYNLTSNKKDGSGVIQIPDNHGQLQNGRFTQENDITTLEFTIDLLIRHDDNFNDIVHEVSSETTWIWAIGKDNNKWEGKHKLYGSFQLDLTSTESHCESITEEPSPSPTFAPNAELMETNDETTDTLEDEEFNDKEMAIPVGEFFDDEDLQHNEAVTESLSSSNADSESSALTSSEQQQQQQQQSTLTTKHQYWIFHGVIMGITWGILAPFTIAATYWRIKANDIHKKTVWFRLQFCLGLSVTFFTILGFALAVIATNNNSDDMDEDTTLDSMQNTHGKTGLAILIMLGVTILGEYFRSRLPIDPRGKISGSGKDIDDGAKRNGNVVGGGMMVINDFSIKGSLSDQEEQGSIQTSTVEEQRDVSLLTTSFYSEHFAILNISSDVSSSENNRGVVKNTKSILNLPSDGNNGSIFEDDDDNDEKSWAIYHSPSRERKSSYDSIRSAISSGAKNDTPATSPDVSRDEEVTSSNKFKINITYCMSQQCWSQSFFMLSMVILGLAWYCCHVGILLQADLADLEQHEGLLLSIFWGFTVGISLLLIAVGYFTRRN